MKNIEIKLETIDRDIFSGKLGDIINSLNDIKMRYPDYSDFCIRNIESMWDDSEEFVLFGSRPETDKEKKVRLAKEQRVAEKEKADKERNKLAAKNKEIKEFERLKKLYGDK